jgi:hypothetical protein
MAFETIILKDASLESSLEFVYKNVDRDEFPDLIKPVQTIGGRLTDLQLFVQQLKNGLCPEGMAFARMIEVTRLAHPPRN